VEKRRCASGSLTKEEVMNAETQQVVIQNAAVPLETGKWGPWLPVMEAPQPVLGAAYVSRQRAPRDIDVFVVAAGTLSYSYQKKWRPIADLRGTPVRNGLSVVVTSDGTFHVYALTDDTLLHASGKGDGLGWDLDEDLSHPPFGNAQQLAVAQDGDVTDLYVTTKRGELYTMRAREKGSWHAVNIGTAIPGLFGAVSSAPGRRDIAFGQNDSVRLFSSIKGAAFVEKEPLQQLGFATTRVMLASPRGAGRLYAIALADDGRIASSPWYEESSDWGHIAYGPKGSNLGFVGTAVATQRGHIETLFTDVAGNLSPRIYD
jgi:hypothetical protein